MNTMLVDTSSPDNLFSGLANLAVQTVQLQWGCALLVVGACLTLTPLFLKASPEDTSQGEFFRLATGWRISAAIISGLFVIAVVIASVWPTKTKSTATFPSTEPELAELGNPFSSEFDEPAQPPKEIPSVSIGSSIVIDEVKVTISGVRIDHIYKESMFGDSTTRSESQYLLVDLALQNISPGRIIYLQQIWEHTKLIDNFDNIESAEFSDGFMMDSILGYIDSAKLMPSETIDDMIIFDLPVDAAQTFRIESDPRFWKSVSEERVRELSDESFKIEFLRSDIRGR